MLLHIVKSTLINLLHVRIGHTGRREVNMKFYCVVQEYHNNGKVYAWITNHMSVNGDFPENKIKEYGYKDVYCDYFTDKKEAIEFCDFVTKR